MMKLVKFGGTLALLGVLLLSSCAFAVPIKVDAVGEAAVISGDKKLAQDQARRNAYRDALEKALGARVEGITEMKEYQVVKDKVFSQTQGLVTKFEVVKEGVKDDIYRIDAYCEVEDSKLDGVLGPAVLDAIGNPRLMIVVDENIDGKTPFLSTVEGEVGRLFEKAGYLLVDKSQADALAGMDEAKLKEAAKNLQADVLIYGRAQSVPFSQQRVSGVNIVAVRSQLQLKAIIMQNAYVLGVEVPETKDKGTTAQDAAVKSLKAAAWEGAMGLVHKVAYSLVSGRKGGMSGRVISITVSNVSFSDVRKIKTGIEATRGVIGVYQRDYSNKKLALDVQFEGTAEDIAVVVEGLGLEIAGLTANTVEANSP